MQRSLPIISIFATLFLLVALTPEFRVSASDTLIYPTKLKTSRGSNGDQSLTVLRVQEQAGTDDRWDAYLEFYPKKGYKGVFTFDLPATVSAAEIVDLSLAVNYLGPAQSEQLWQWKMRNFCSNKWVQWGDNQDTIDWTWSALNFVLPGRPSCYVDDNHQLKLQYGTRTDTGVSNIDYLALVLHMGDDPPVGEDPPLSSQVWQPDPGTSWQWQLTGPIDTSLDVQIYDIDLFDTPQGVIDQLHAEGRVVICYFSAGSWENWRPDADQFPDTVKGKSNGWPGEKWLDIRQISILGPIVGARLDLAAQKKCDGVEPDNVDGYTNNTGFPLSSQDQLDYLVWLANAAHSRSLSIGLKNNLEQVDELVSHFDWALNEQCFQYEECELLLPFVNSGKAVFGVEYSGSMGSFCPEANAMDFDWLKKNIDLDSWRAPCR